MPVDPITQAAVMGMKYVAAYLMAASRCDRVTDWEVILFL